MFRVFAFILFSLIGNKYAFAQFIEEISPSGIEAQLIEAQKQELIGNPDKSIELLEKMRNIPETRAAVYYQLSRLYKSKSKLEDALNAINESIIADPKNKWTRVYQANLYESIGKYQMAAESYEAVIKIEPENYTMYDLAALNYLKSDQAAKALSIMDLAHTKFGATPKVAIQKNKLLQLVGKNKKGIELLLQAEKEYPKNTELMIEIIQFYFQNNQLEEAANYTKKLQSIKPNHPFLNSLSQSTQKSSSDISDSEIENSIDPDPIVKKIIPELKNINNNNFDKFINIADKLCKKFPKDPKTWALKADILYGNDKLIEATSAYNTAIGLATVPYTIWENYIVCLMKLTHWKTLEEKTNVALDYYPNQSFIFYALALAQFNLKNYSDTKIQIEQFALMNKNSPSRLLESNILKARIFDETNKQDQAAELWSQCIASEKNEVAIIEYCYSLSRKGKTFPEDKLVKATASQELSMDYILSRMAAINFYAKDYARADQNINACLNLSAGQNSENFELAYLIFNAKGDKTNARILLSKALEYSDNKEYYQNILNRLN
ncbi:MAG: hypothetical protein HOP11_10465 [Saprospiraceae bacterium]|nr:hypothetical protein [Saprospiraceae bacterium]